MRKTKVFVDSDVVISSLLSQKGAAYLLINEQNSNFVISNISREELEKIVDKLKLNEDKLQNLIKKRLRTIKLTVNLEKIKKDFQGYTSDPNDAHIIAGAVKGKSKFLLTYNLRHFKRQEINDNFGIIVLTPAQYLQYLRSLE